MSAATDALNAANSLVGQYRSRLATAESDLASATALYGETKALYGETLARAVAAEAEAARLREHHEILRGVRPAVVSFAVLMEEVLRAHDHKGGWGPDNCTVDYLLRRLGQEVGELRRAWRGWADDRDDARCQHEAADVANFAMMVADRCGLARRAIPGGQP